MPARAMVFEGTRIGPEVTEGVPVAATRDLGALGFMATPAPEVKSFTPAGGKYPTTSVYTKEQTNFKLDGMATYTELQYPLSGVLTAPVITTPGGATTARLWTYSINSNAPDSPVTYTVEKGTDALRAAHYPGVRMTDLSLAFSRNDMVKITGAAFGPGLFDDTVRWLTIVNATGGTYTITINGQVSSAIAYNATAATVDTAVEAITGVGTGKAFVTGGPGGTNPLRIAIDPSVVITSFSVNGASLTGAGAAANLTRLSPNATQLALLPISPTEIDIYTATSFALLDSATAYTNVFDFNWGITGRFNPYFPLNTSYGTTYAGTNEVMPKTSLSFSVGGDDVMGSFIRNVRKQDLIYVRVRARGPLIETGFYNELKIDTAVRLNSIGEDKDVSGGGLLGKTFGGEWMRDPTTGRPTVVTLQNTQTAL